MMPVLMKVYIKNININRHFPVMQFDRAGPVEPRWRTLRNRSLMKRGYGQRFTDF